MNPAEETAWLVRREDLTGRRVLLNSGGFGAVHGLESFRLPGDPRRLVYKEFLRPQPGSVSPLVTIIRAPEKLPLAERAELHRATAWPLRVVVDASGLAVGILMHLVETPFTQRVRLPSGSRETILREIQHLMVDEGKCRRIGVDFPEPGDGLDRLRLCREFARAIELMHSCGVVYGDVSARNTVFALRPRPAVLFVDCDAVRLRGHRSFAEQANSPDWDPPEAGSTGLNVRSDDYKVALFVLRCLAPGDGASVSRDPGRAAPFLTATGRDMLERGMAADPDHRPTAGEWVRYFDEVVRSRTAPAELLQFIREDTAVVVGSPVRLRWATRAATELVVTMPDGSEVVEDASTGAGVLEVFPSRSGELTAFARNGHGISAPRRGGAVHVIGVADVVTLELPDVAVSALLDRARDEDAVLQRLMCSDEGLHAVVAERTDALAASSRASLDESGFGELLGGPSIDLPMGFTDAPSPTCLLEPAAGRRRRWWR